MKKFFLAVKLFMIISIFGTGIIVPCKTHASIKFRKCPNFYLRTETGDIINPVSGNNSDKPYSTRKTCGAAGCHDYDAITKGFHFQQGWDKIKDNFSKEKPWVLSDGMMGKM